MEEQTAPVVNIVRIDYDHMLLRLLLLILLLLRLLTTKSTSPTLFPKESSVLLIM